ncbi:MAG: hypothetical protein MZV49_15875 [Rhodopseudomonas palustris]|nr:hypothetical protein [Rhodopseudomonas palustris]
MLIIKPAPRAPMSFVSAINTFCARLCASFAALAKQHGRLRSPLLPGLAIWRRHAQRYRCNQPLAASR